MTCSPYFIVYNKNEHYTIQKHYHSGLRLLDPTAYKCNIVLINKRRMEMCSTMQKTLINFQSSNIHKTVIYTVDFTCWQIKEEYKDNVRCFIYNESDETLTLKESHFFFFPPILSVVYRKSCLIVSCTVLQFYVWVILCFLLQSVTLDTIKTSDTSAGIRGQTFGPKDTSTNQPIC